MSWHPDIPEEYRNQIVTGDARELAKHIPDGSFALAFADPPYWVGFDYGHSTDRQMDYIEPSWLVSALRRVAPIVCITPGIANLWKYPEADWVLGWFKFGSTGRNMWGGFNVWEPVLVYGKAPRGMWQDAIDLPQARNTYNENGSLVSLQKVCPKPERLLNWLINGLTRPGDNVLDPTAGLGTTAVVAKKLGRNFTAFEIDPDTAERARERVLLTQPPLPGLLEEQEVMALEA